MPPITPTTPAPVEVNWGAFAASLTVVLKDELIGVVEGASQDIENFLVDISQDLTRAMRSGNSELTDEIKNQSMVVLELNRLRVVGTQMRVLDRILGTALGIGTALLGNVTGMAVGAIRNA